MRADQLLVDRGIAASRSQAQRLIAAGMRWRGPRGWQAVAKNGDELPLTTGEFAMLKALVRHPRQPLSREKLAQLARGREFEPFDRSLDVQVSRLRKLVEADPAAPRYIQTVWGVGYVFVPDGAG